MEKTDWGFKDSRRKSAEDGCGLIFQKTLGKTAKEHHLKAWRKKSAKKIAKGTEIRGWRWSSLARRAIVDDIFQGNWGAG